MKKRLMKLTMLTMAMVAMLCGLTACGNTGSGSELSGTISLNGSTSMEKVAKALQEGFMRLNPGVTVEVEFTGSGTGIQAAIDGTADIGNSSRNLKDEEIAKGLVENVIAIDGIAVIIDNNNQVVDITAEELAKIYTGEIKNWSELGGADLPIVVVGRESASGTRGAFEELLDIEDKCKYAQEIDSTGGVLSTVASTTGAIGYVSLDVIDDTVTVMAIDGMIASEENIAAEKYALSRPFVMATKGAITEQSEIVQAFFAYIKSEEGQAIIKKVGLILPE